MRTLVVALVSLVLATPALGAQERELSEAQATVAESRTMANQRLAITDLQFMAETPRNRGTPMRRVGAIRLF